MLELWALVAVGIGFGSEFGVGVGFATMGAAYLLMPVGGRGRMEAIDGVAREIKQLRELLEKKS